MSVQYAPSKLKVPPGFQNLLEGLAREVLREQPNDIIKFSADYFKGQMALRSVGEIYFSFFAIYLIFMTLALGLSIWTCSLKKASSVTFHNLLKINYCR